MGVLVSQAEMEEMGGMQLQGRKDRKETGGSQVLIYMYHADENSRKTQFGSCFVSFTSPGETGVRGLTGDKGHPGEKGERGQPGECAVAPKSAFSVKLSQSVAAALTVGDAVRFDTVLINEQGDYNSETGRFTCKVPGVYYFAVHATVYRASLQFDLMKNGHAVASYFQFYGNWPKPVSLSGGSLLHLVPGDQVWIQMALSEYNGFYSSTKTDSTFTGFLVYSDWKNSAVFA